MMFCRAQVRVNVAGVSRAIIGISLSRRGRGARAWLMASDSDIVRCTAPWPGTAARLLQGLAVLGPGTWPVEKICQASASGTEPGHASQILAGLAGAGLCTAAAGDDSWLCEYAPARSCSV